MGLGGPLRQLVSTQLLGSPDSLNPGAWPSGPQASAWLHEGIEGQEDWHGLFSATAEKWYMAVQASPATRRSSKMRREKETLTHIMSSAPRCKHLEQPCPQHKNLTYVSYCYYP